MGDVVDLKCITTLDLPADRIIAEAAKANLKSVVMLGYDEEGQEYFVSSIASGPEIVWLLERCKHKLLNLVDE